MTATGTLICDNVACYGGGVYAYQPQSGGSMSLVNCTIANNHAFIGYILTSTTPEGSSGGGFYCYLAT